MTTGEIDGVLTLLAVAYDRDLSRNEALVDLWYELFAPYDGAAIRAAALQHLARSPYWPKPSDLITPVAEAGLSDADEAWAAVTAEVRRAGYAGTPAFTDPVVADTVRRVGWQAICQSEQPDVVRGQFRLFYTLARTRTATDRAVAPLLTAFQARGLALPGRPLPEDAP